MVIFKIYLKSYRLVSFVRTDNCCSDAALLHEVFGQDCLVRLDPFHALQRITRCVKKKDAPRHIRQSFFKELRLIIRDPMDRKNEKRELPTPNIEDMTKSINSIIENHYWQTHIPKKALTELEKLRDLHVSNGCLR